MKHRLLITSVQQITRTHEVEVEAFNREKASLMFKNGEITPPPLECEITIDTLTYTEHKFLPIAPDCPNCLSNVDWRISFTVEVLEDFDPRTAGWVESDASYSSGIFECTNCHNDLTCDNTIAALHKFRVETKL